jgi:chemotaxis protein histidine kinase CheA
MSDEFITLATKEINEELLEFSKILLECKNDDDVHTNSEKFQKHTHKIKGLAPMMGKEMLGNFSGDLDFVLKKIIDGDKIDNVFDLLTVSMSLMQNSMSDSKTNFLDVKNRFSEIFKNLN